MASTRYIHVVADDELHEVWGLSARTLARLTRRNDFPPPVEPPQHESGVWRSIPALREWLATTGYRQPLELTLDWWPDAHTPADFGGAQRVDGGDIVLQHWHTSAGHLVVIWHPDPIALNGAEVASMAQADGYVLVGADWGVRGPALWCWPGKSPRTTAKTEADWHDLARVLGQPAPFWPDRLQKPELIEAWKPGDPPVRDVGIVPREITPLMHMALQYPSDHIVHRALLHVAQTAALHSSAGESVDLEILQDRMAHGSLSEDHIVLAAVPAPPIANIPAPIDPTALRAGLREVLGRADRLAEECARILMRWDRGQFLPWSSPLPLPPSSAREEFFQRLEPAPERTAVYAALEESVSGRGTALVDPATDTPVLVPDHPTEHARALPPHRLAATSPLAEIIVDAAVWVRTQDGVLYLAPRAPHTGLNWGYSGGGPHLLATLAHRLLRDITAPAPVPNEGDTTPEDLVRLFEYPWEAGTVITRAQLERTLH